MIFDLTPAGLISRAIVLLIGMAVHEYAHARMAYAMGDSTAKDAGRMTLNPLVNIYPVGFIIGVIIGFAVLGSAPVNPYRMRNRRWGLFAAVLAGPVSNLLVAIVAAVPFRLGLLTLSQFGSYKGLLPTLDRLMTDMLVLNLLLFVFNLLPLYPLDGWTVAFTLLPPEPAIWWERNKTNSMYVMYGLIALSFLSPNLANLGLRGLNPLDWLIGVPVQQLINILVFL